MGEGRPGPQDPVQQQRGVAKVSTTGDQLVDLSSTGLSATYPFVWLLLVEYLLCTGPGVWW